MAKQSGGKIRKSCRKAKIAPSRGIGQEIRANVKKGVQRKGKTRDGVDKQARGTKGGVKSTTRQPRGRGKNRQETMEGTNSKENSQTGPKLPKENRIQEKKA